MRGKTTARTVIVGAGISGASLARELARDLALAGDRPLLLEADRPGSGATGRNAGFLLAESDCPGLAERRHGAVVEHLPRQAGLRTRDIVDALAGDRPRRLRPRPRPRPRRLRLRRSGNVRLAEDSGEARALARGAAAIPDLAVLDPQSVREAGAACGAYTHALTDPGDAVLHPSDSLPSDSLPASTSRPSGRAGTIRHDATPVRELRRKAGRIEVVTADGVVVVVVVGGVVVVVRAERVIVTTNCALRALLRTAARVRPVRAADHMHAPGDACAGDGVRAHVDLHAADAERPCRRPPAPLHSAAGHPPPASADRPSRVVPPTAGRPAPGRPRPCRNVTRKAWRRMGPGLRFRPSQRPHRGLRRRLTVPR